MNKKMMLIQILALLLTTSLLSAFVNADTTTTIAFEGKNPDITVSAQAELKAGYSTYRETSTFSLAGDGYAIGGVTMSTGTYHCCRTLPKAVLSGGYTASDGDFQSVFESSDVTWKSNPYSTTVPEFESAMYFSQHSLSVTGVTSMTVTGDATAKCGWGQPLSAGQTFSGNALDIDVLGLTTRQEMIVDSGLHPILDVGGNFQFYAASDFVVADLSGSALGSSPIDFGGHTGGEYRTTNPGGSSSTRNAELDYNLWLQKSATIYPNPLTAYVGVYAPDASPLTINAYISPTEVWGDVSYSIP
uniref:Uncharacterized protein n=1 Tax=viral metagenome TaxID=1070528 RepID=A0A6M3LW69_9ZZZZ